MADYTSVSIVLGIISLLALFFTSFFYREAIFVILSLVMVALSAAGYSITSGLASQGIFEIFLILSMLSLPLTILHFMATKGMEYLQMWKSGRM